jgi:hypothetical protein
MRRIVLRSILTLVLFFITVSLANELLKGVAYLLMQAGSTTLRDWYQGHFAWRALTVGILAGLSPANLCFSVFLWFPSKENPDAPRKSRFLNQLNVVSAQRWTWVFFTPALILILRGWIESQSRNSSVLDVTSHYSLSSFIAYWNAELEYMDPRSHLYANDWVWIEQVFRIWIVTASAGYSLAPSIRQLGISAYKSMYQQQNEAIEEEAPESTMSEKIDPQ